MKFTITVLSFLFAITCIPYAICDKQFYARVQLLEFGVGSLIVWLLLMAVKTYQKRQVIKKHYANANTNN